jgi:low affinity Fe/Cu permease
VPIVVTRKNRDAQPIHLKLDELIRANRNARNLLAGIETCSEEELQALQKEFERLRSARTPAAPWHRPANPDR